MPDDQGPAQVRQQLADARAESARHRLAWLSARRRATESEEDAQRQHANNQRLEQLLANATRAATRKIAREPAVMHVEGPAVEASLRDGFVRTSEARTERAEAERARYRAAWLSARDRAAQRQVTVNAFLAENVASVIRGDFRLPHKLAAAEAERDGAYRERAHLVAWLAALHPAVIVPAPDVTDPGWQILYLTAGGHQLSWHIAPADVDLFAHVEQVPASDWRAQWDGHTTEQKYERIRALTGGRRARPGCPDPIECAHEAALGQAEAARDAALARLDYAQRCTIPDLERRIADHRASQGRWRARAETAEARLAAGGRTLIPDTVGPARQAAPPTMAAMYKLAEAAGAAHQQSAQLLEEWIYQRATSIGLTVHWSTSRVEQIAGHPTAIDQLSAVLAPAARADLFGSIGSFTGLPLIPDEALPPGEIHLRPHPRPADGPSTGR